MNSKRKFRVVTLAPTKTEVIVEDFKISLNDLLQEGNETAYALQDIIDEVMDIPEGCSMYFNPVRGCITAKGIIHRLT